MKPTNLIKTFLAAGLLTASASCSDFLEEYSQDKARVETWEDLDELLLGDGHLEPCRYSTEEGVRETPHNLDILHFMTDELTENPNTDIDPISYRENMFAFYTWQQDTGMDEEFNYAGGDERYWNMLYEKINTCNMVLALIDEQPEVNEDDTYGKERVKGEAYFLRAAYYFLLANLYAEPYNPQTAASTPGVPIKLTEYVEDREFMREPLADVYAQVLDDLEQAEAYLTGKTRVTIYHPDLAATCLLRSRVYLYMQDWEAAAAEAQRVLGMQSSLLDLHSLPEGQDAVYASSPETIFSMGGYLVALATADWRSWASECFPDYFVSDDMVSLYQSNDLRATRYIGSSEEYGLSPVFLKKSGQYSTWGSYDEVSDCFLLRTPEAYLTLAEASAFAGDETTARRTLETFLDTRMNQAVSVTEGGNALIDLIREERAREFLLEGHRWFDLRRYTVCQPYPWSKTIEHAHNYFEDLYDSNATYADWYRLEENDVAYTLSVPRAIREFQVSIGTITRPARRAFRTENY